MFHIALGIVPALILLCLAAPSAAAETRNVSAYVAEKFAACKNACTVTLPDGNLTYDQTIIVPCMTLGSAALVGGSGTVLRYVGREDAIATAPTCGKTPKANLKIRGFRLRLTPAARSGIRLVGFNRGDVEDVMIDGGGVPGKPSQGADGILIEGANSISLRNVTLHGNKNGLHNKGVVSTPAFDGGTYSGTANGIKVFGGEIYGNVKCGIFEDGSAGIAKGNSYIGVVFEENGTDNDAATGHLCLQTIYGANITDNYFEYGAAKKVPYAIWLGDANAKDGVAGVTISGNRFISPNSAATIRAVRADSTTIIGNSEVEPARTFLEHGEDSKETFLYQNHFPRVKTAKSGPIRGVSGHFKGVRTFAEVKSD